MKRTLPCALLTAALLTFPVRAARTVPVQIDNTLLSAPSVLDRGVTYVPLRSFLDTLGGWEIYWDKELAAAVAFNPDLRIVADPASNTVTVGDTQFQAKVYVENGRTYVPLRLTAEALDASVQWDPYLGGAAVTSPGAPYDAVELYWLSRVISAESRGESLEGQIAVGNVVLNRRASTQFPNSIPEVVFDRVDGVQFEPTANGTIYDLPTEQSVRAARMVLDGEVVFDNALYFYAPSLSAGTWINENCTYLATIGCHRFYY